MPRSIVLRLPTCAVLFRLSCEAGSAAACQSAAKGCVGDAAARKKEMAALTEATAALQAVKLDGFALADQPRKLRDDDKLVLAAVSENGGALQYASERLRDDEAVVKAALSSQGEAL